MNFFRTTALLTVMLGVFPGILLLGAGIPSPEGRDLPASLQLEEAVFELEVGGDREAARRLLESIQARPGEALPPVWAEATFRLAELLFGKGETAEGRRLAQTLRDQGGIPQPWRGRAMELLTRTSRLPPTVRPWPNDEYLLYQIRSLGGSVIGYYSSWSADDYFDGQPVFRLRSWLHVDLSQVAMVHDLVSERVEDGFRLLRITGRNPVADRFSATFDPASRVWSWEENGAERAITLPAGNLYVDNEQTMHLPRALDRRENPVFPVHILFPVGLSGEAVYRFIGMEALEGRDADGLFERWDFEMRDAQFSVYNATVWVDPDGPRRVVRMRSSHMSIELARAKERPQMAPYEGEIDALGWAYTVPDGWSGMDFGRVDNHLNQVHVLSGDGRTFAVWLVNPPNPDRTLEEAVQADVRRLRSFLQDFTVVEGSETEIKIHGRPARRIEGQFLDRGVPARSLRVYWKDNDKIHWVVIRGQESAWETQLPEALTFLESIRPLEDPASWEGAP
ncbi:MAG: hypothetical protein JJT96_04865 [Opitutales bacterium]|nr:hypothetical protein [Opitutales bacterium]